MKSFCLVLGLVLFSQTSHSQSDYAATVDAEANKTDAELKAFDKRMAALKEQMVPINTALSDKPANGESQDAQQARAEKVIGDIQGCIKTSYTKEGCTQKNLDDARAWLADIKSKTQALHAKVNTLWDQYHAEEAKRVAYIAATKDKIPTSVQLHQFEGAVHAASIGQEIDETKYDLLSADYKREQKERVYDKAEMGLYLRNKLDKLSKNFCTAQKECATDENKANGDLLGGVFTADPKSTTATQPAAGTPAQK